MNHTNSTNCAQCGASNTESNLKKIPVYKQGNKTAFLCTACRIDNATNTAEIVCPHCGAITPSRDEDNRDYGGYIFIGKNFTCHSCTMSFYVTGKTTYHYSSY